VYCAEVLGEVGLLFELRLADGAAVLAFVFVDCGDVAHEAVLEGERLGTYMASEGLVLVMDAHDVLVEVALLAERRPAYRALVRLGRRE